MSYIKFDYCILAEQSKELFKAYKYLNSYVSELKTLENTLEKQLMNYKGVRDAISSATAELTELLSNILFYGKSLESVAENYYAAEKRTRTITDNLPTSLVLKGIKTKPESENGAFSDSIKLNASNTAEIRNSAIVLENWLAEFLYKSK